MLQLSPFVPYALMKRTTRYIIPALVLFIVGAALGFQFDRSASDGSMDELRKLEEAFMQINRNYVEEVDARNLSESAIRKMLEELDPHSAFIPAEEVERLQDSYRGSFGGVGIWFEIVDDTARVISPIDGGPSQDAGVRAGDRIIQIEDSSAVGLTNQGVQERLRGEIDTRVRMTVERLGVEDPMTFTITRGEIPLYSVTGAHMIDEQTGYVQILRFAQTTYDEFKEAVAELEAQGMERLVIDMRSNPGGVMESAIRMADEFLGRGMPIVSTKGRTMRDQSFRASGNGSMRDGSVIVMVDPRSASASEIVAGALQDHDRALVVGQRTFGKGLVQRQFPLPDGSMMQMTTARYYTPSGRLIQSPYDGGGQDAYMEAKFETLEQATLDPDGYRASIPDSLRFETAQGRTVFGGGGIMPDHVLPPDTAAAPVAQAIYQRAFSPLARQWFSQNEQEIREEWGERRDAFLETFAASDDLIEQMLAPAFAEDARSDFGLRLVTDEADARPDNSVFHAADVQERQDMLATFVKGYLAQQLYGSDVATPIYRQLDPELKEALKLWDEADKLAMHHRSNGTTGFGDARR